VGLVSGVPLGGSGMSSGFMADGGSESVGDADYRVVDGDYFAALGIPLLRGRAFAATDHANAPHVAIVSRSMADRYWPGVDVLGRRVRLPGMDDHKELWLTVVGVVDDVKHEGLDAPPAPTLFVHYAQRPERLTNGATVVVRASTPPALLSAAVRSRVRAVDGTVPVKVSTMSALVEESVASRRFSTVLLSTFAALALALAALGIYSVLAYTVVQRRQEIGVRMALGAQRGSVRAMVLRDAMVAVLPGIAAGMLGARALARFLRGLLYEVSSADPLTIGAVALLLASVALLASWLPAHRAARVDPMVAIRAD
jgi:predicted permease